MKTEERMSYIVLHNPHISPVCIHVTLQLIFLSLSLSREYFLAVYAPPSLCPPPDLDSDLTNQPQEAPAKGLVSPDDHLMLCGAPLSIYLGPVPTIA